MSRRKGYPLGSTEVHRHQRTAEAPFQKCSTVNKRGEGTAWRSWSRGGGVRCHRSHHLLQKVLDLWSTASRHTARLLSLCRVVWASFAPWRANRTLACGGSPSCAAPPHQGRTKT